MVERRGLLIVASPLLRPIPGAIRMLPLFGLTLAVCALAAAAAAIFAASICSYNLEDFLKCQKETLDFLSLQISGRKLSIRLYRI